MKLACALVTLAACVTPDLDSTSVIAQPIGCGSWGCGQNSATVGDGLIFDELDSSQTTPNSSGLVIVKVTSPDLRAAKLQVTTDVLSESAIDGSGRTYSGTDLVGTVIELKSVDTGVHYEVQISGVQLKALPYWQGAAEWVPFYEMRARTFGGKQWLQYACKSELTSDPEWTGVVHSAIVFTGDRYNGVSKTVTATAAGDPWFNVACAATAPAKLHLNRHTAAGSYNELGAVTYPTTVEQRQALLKLITADYCGTGHSFTVDGTPLAYNANQAWWHTDSSWHVPEAIWKGSGAVCVSTTRLSSTTRAQINAECGYTMPACDDPNFTSWPKWGYAMSAMVTAP